MMVLGILFTFLAQPAFGGEGIYRDRSVGHTSSVGHITEVLQYARTPIARALAAELLGKSSTLVLAKDNLESRMAHEALNWAVANDKSDIVRRAAEHAHRILSHSIVKMKAAQAHKFNLVSDIEPRFATLASSDVNSLLKALAKEDRRETTRAMLEILYEDFNTKFARGEGAWEESRESAAVAARVVLSVQLFGDGDRFDSMLARLADGLNSTVASDDRAELAVKIAESGPIVDERVLGPLRDRITRGGGWERIRMLRALRRLDSRSIASQRIFESELYYWQTNSASLIGRGRDWEEHYQYCREASVQIATEALEALREAAPPANLAPQPKGWLGRVWNACGRALGDLK